MCGLLNENGRHFLSLTVATWKPQSIALHYHHNAAGVKITLKCIDGSFFTEAVTSLNETIGCHCHVNNARQEFGGWAGYGGAFFKWFLWEKRKERTHLSDFFMGRVPVAMAAGTKVLKQIEIQLMKFIFKGLWLNRWFLKRIKPLAEASEKLICIEI